jgi:predicted RNase H-like HicB family nuclease
MILFFKVWVERRGRSVGNERHNLLGKYPRDTSTDCNENSSGQRQQWPYTPPVLMSTQGTLMRPIKIIVEKHPDGYVAYPVGMKGAIVGEGGTYEEAVADVSSAIRFHIETFGKDAFEEEDIIDTRIAEVIV